jgi:hypothetical protein
MDQKDFKKGKAGRLIKGTHGYWVFLPDPLPPSLSIDWNLVNLGWVGPKPAKPSFADRSIC